MKAENDYKKQIRELQSALATERQKNTAMAKGLIPKEFLHNYARIQIEKDREEDVYRKALIKILGKISSTPSLPLLQDIQEISEGALNTPINID